MSWASAIGFQLHRPSTQRIEICTGRAEAASWNPPIGKQVQSTPLPRSASPQVAATGRDEAQADATAAPYKVSSRGRDDALPLSLYTPYGAKLPYDGKTQTDFEETCDPMTRNCQTSMHVWESTCRPCFGTGSICSTSRRGRRSTYVCLSCHGLGVVRKTSARIIPDVNAGNGQYTLNRPPAPIIEDETRTPRLDRWKSRRKD